MLKAAAWLSALSVILSTAMPGAVDLTEAVADHDLHPGLGHPAGGDGEHQHGDPDDHHETPDSPCHHHDTHTCCGTTVPLALVAASDGPDGACAGRIRLPQIQAFIRPFVVEFLHVPLA